MRLDVVDLLVAQYPGTAPTGTSRILLVGTTSTCTTSTAVDLARYTYLYIRSLWMGGLSPLDDVRDPVAGAALEAVIGELAEVFARLDAVETQLGVERARRTSRWRSWEV